MGIPQSSRRQPESFVNRARVSVEVEQPTGHSHSRKKTTLEPLQEIDDVSAHVLLLLQNDE
jgi:hypothetical protein